MNLSEEHNKLIKKYFIDHNSPSKVRISNNFFNAILEISESSVSWDLYKILSIGTKAEITDWLNDEFNPYKFTSGRTDRIYFAG